MQQRLSEEQQQVGWKLGYDVLIKGLLGMLLCMLQSVACVFRYLERCSRGDNKECV
jgi:hypothetical protein